MIGFFAGNTGIFFSFVLLGVGLLLFVLVRICNPAVSSVVCAELIYKFVLSGG